MKVDPRDAVMFVPPDISRGKLSLFYKLAETVGGTATTVDELASLPDRRVPIVGCSWYIGEMVRGWLKRGRPFVYWDRGYMRRRGLTWLPEGEGNGYYRWNLSAFQMSAVVDRPADRWERLKLSPPHWQRGGRDVLVLAPSDSYAKFHGLPEPSEWARRVAAKLRRITSRPVVVRGKGEMVPLPLMLQTAHCVVTHGSNAAVESAFLGVPVFCDRECAASSVGRSIDDLALIEDPAYPDREPWLRALAYGQFTDREMLDGTMWELLE